MVENKDYSHSFESIRAMSTEILEASEDLVEMDLSAIDGILLPRVYSYLTTRSEGVWLPEGYRWPLQTEFGLNLFFNVVNFCYQDPTTGHEYVYLDNESRKIKRSTGLLAAMARSEVDWASLSSIRDISVPTWRKMTQISDSNSMFLADERRDKVVGFANRLLSLGYGGTLDLLIDSEYSASKMILILNESGYFDDKFMKRSQLACRMTSEVLVRRGHEPLSDLDKLTVMADYRIPQVFYNLAAVNIVDQELADKLENGQPILSNSREEKALRSTAVVVGKMVANKMGVSEAEVDNILWGLSQDMVKKGEMVIPHMIVATDAY